MAFDSANFVLDRGINNSITNATGPAIHRYISSDDTLSTISGSAYFNNALPVDSSYSLTNQAGTLAVGDLIYVVGSNTSGFLEVSAISPNVTTTSLVTSAPYYIQYAGQESNGGGSATIAITVTGALTTDLGFASVEASTNAVAIQKVTVTSNTVTVLLDGDPGAATLISYQVVRAA